MFAFLSAVAAAALYWGSDNEHRRLVILGTAVAIVLMLISTGVGAGIGRAKPALARWLLSAWNVAVVLITGGLGALVIAAGVAIAVGDEASDRSKAIVSAVGAIITLAGTGVGDWLSKHSAPWLSNRVVLARYGHYFPCLPVKDGPGRSAYKIMGKVRKGAADAAGMSGVQGTLAAVSAAVTAGQVSGGSDWQCVEPPAPSP